MTFLVTGFGPFLDVTDNASARLASSLDGELIAGHAAVGRVLPTSFGRARAELKRHVAEARPALVIALGVAREEALRLEARAAALVTSEHPDIDGETWQGRHLGPAALSTPWPLARWATHLDSASNPLPVRVSDDCGGYVCNATYHAALEVAPALFVHLPRTASDDPATFEFVRTAICTLARLALDEVATGAAA